MTTALPVLKVDGGLAEALGLSALQRLTSSDLQRFLLERRWFGAKGRKIAAVRIADVVPVEHGHLRAAIARLEVDLGGETLSYQLPLTVRVEPEGESLPKATLARVEGSGAGGILFDAVEDAEFRAMVGTSFRDGATFAGRESEWVIAPVVRPTADAGRSGEPPAALASLTADTTSKVLSGEQSNTSIIYGDAAILKLFRRLESGENPDVEIGRFLTTRTRFENIPTLLGTIHLQRGTDGGARSVAGMLQRFVAGSTDAWRDTLTRARGYFAAPADADPENAFLPDAEELGRVTRAMHDALASDPDDPEFAPQPATRDDVARWADATRRSLDESTALLAERVEAGAIAGERANEAKVIVRRREAYHEFIGESVALLGGDAGERIRHHGDYHLGQVLRAPDGTFMVIDFEGEPARPIAERRQRHSALRDVAGMLRSFAYAAATLAVEQRDATDLPMHVLELRAGRWERDVRAAYLRGYLHQPLPSHLPAAREKIDALLALFEAEKVFYELAYELNNRPDWVWIPIRGISKLLVAPTSKPVGRR